MLKRLTKYYLIWLMTAKNALQQAFINRGTNVLFIMGKSIRFVMAVVFTLILRDNVSQVGGYDSEMLLVFILTYHALETLGQVFFRGAYQFGELVRSGSFDGLLTKPVNALFTALTGHPDLNDALFLIATMAISVYLISTSSLAFTSLSIGLYLLLLANGFLILTAIHIFIMCFTLLSSDVDNIMFLYRDIGRLGQFPVTIYHNLVRPALFFIVPLGFMFTIPAQILLQVEPSYNLLITTGFGVGFFLLSLKTWNWTLTKYSSASS